MALLKGTNFYEIAQLPYYNYLSRRARRNDMVALRKEFGTHSRQYFILYTPKEGAVKNEIIVYFHGGGWTLGNPQMFRSNAQFFVDRGYAVVMPSYRRLPFYRSADMAEDARLAMTALQEITRAKKWEDKKFLIGGMSSGAHLAALLAFDRKRWPEIPLSEEQLAGVFLFGPPLDLTKMSWTPVIGRLAGSRKQPYFQKSNPISYIKDGEEAPTLIVHGTKDGLVNYRSTESFVEKRGHKNLTLHTIDKGSHLDAAYWFFRENEIQKAVLDWFAEQSE